MPKLLSCFGGRSRKNKYVIEEKPLPLHFNCRSKDSENLKSFEVSRQKKSDSSKAQASPDIKTVYY